MLNFKYHIQTISKKLSCALYFIRNAKNVLSSGALLHVYYSLFHSHLIYGIQIWSSCSSSQINGLFKIQKKAIRLINLAPYNSHTESLFKKSKILPLNQLIEYFNLQVMHKYFQGLLPVSFNEIWITREAYRQNSNIVYSLRNNDNLYIPVSRLSSLDKHPYFNLPRLWQEFPSNEIKILREKSLFNVQLKLYFLSKLDDNYVCNRLLCPHCHLGTVSSESE